MLHAIPFNSDDLSFKVFIKDFDNIFHNNFDQSKDYKELKISNWTNEEKYKIIESKLKTIIHNSLKFLKSIKPTVQQFKLNSVFTCVSSKILKIIKNNFIKFYKNNSELIFRIFQIYMLLLIKYKKEEDIPEEIFIETTNNKLSNKFKKQEIETITQNLLHFLKN